MAPTYAGMSGRPLGLTVSTIATMGFLLFGYDQGVMSGIIDSTPFADILPITDGNSTMQALVTAVYELGCLAGAMFALFAGDKMGRRLMVIWGAFVMIIGVVIQVACVKGHGATAQFFVGRIVTGIGNGMNTSTIPTYQAECSRSSNRGLLICIEGGIIAIGTMIAYWIDFGASYGPDDLAWRFPIAFQIVFGVIIIVGMYYLPDSPRYLIAQGKVHEGEYVLAALGGYEIDSHETQMQKQLVIESIEAAGVADGAGYSDLLTGGKTQHLRRMLIGSSSQIAQQLSGCNAVIYYLPVLLKSSLGQDHFMSMLIGGINMIVYAIFATFSWFFIEKIGRRKLFIGGMTGQMVSMVIVFGCLIPGGTGPAKGAVFGLFLYMSFFGASILPLPWLYPAEISPLRTRAKANAVSTCSNWLFNFTVVMITPVMIASINWRTYLFFAIMNAVFIPGMYLFYPETAGRSLEEIDLIFAKGYCENMSYVKAAYELPRLTDDEIEAKAAEYGFETSRRHGDVEGAGAEKSSPRSTSSDGKENHEDIENSR
ncbi:General substrate transporter [Penicillium brevicompactum]|uniref:General substrate transporter n=1 Tax=Penicillium brevicompactum TaxID=5074 RepID=A0A9W9UDD9_PENBR|nr:General substrate transporter [Penicillium brevicompactum]KAJ5330125.1 General substrate transporter [Penicillium brevicompactum]KAJ5344312.1 General substrate transporter [Penicillium brevicompactum]KAJ5354866.1 General substrate transporter [Penicillium brevicompactum]